MPQQYDPMVDFYKRALDLLFKQAPTVILAIVGLYLLWQKLERVDVQRVADRLEVRKECAEAIADIRGELRHCVAQKDTLLVRYAEQAAKLAALQVAQRRIERRARTAPSFGAND